MFAIIVFKNMQPTYTTVKKFEVGFNDFEKHLFDLK